MSEGGGATKQLKKRGAFVEITTLQRAAAAGVTSQVAEVQALALATLARIVEKAGPERIRPHLPELVPALLEALSGLEVGRAPGGLRSY